MMLPRRQSLESNVHRRGTNSSNSSSGGSSGGGGGSTKSTKGSGDSSGGESSGVNGGSAFIAQVISACTQAFDELRDLPVNSQVDVGRLVGELALVVADKLSPSFARDVIMEGLFKRLLCTYCPGGNWFRDRKTYTEHRTDVHSIDAGGDGDGGGGAGGAGGAGGGGGGGVRQRGSRSPLAA
jgi:hypothetical protein